MATVTPRKLVMLLADDDQTFHLLVEERLKHLPKARDLCTLRCVCDGLEAVQYISGQDPFSDRHKFPVPDVVLLDERMLRMDGSDALQEIKKQASAITIPICMFSTTAQPRWQRLCYQRGAAFCIQKPLDYEMLGVKLRLIIEFFTQVLELPSDPNGQ